jgi:transcriptional regulator with XRE-family HTH domain
MTGLELRLSRKDRGWTQKQAASRLGVSQPYLALLEAEKRKLPGKLTRKAINLYGFSPTALPPTSGPLRRVSADMLARDLASLGYPGFAYMRSGWKKNPGEVLLTALAQPDLESRLTEALPWLMLKYPKLDTKWVVSQARLFGLSNRLGFVVDLAKSLAKRQDQVDCFAQLAQLLRASRLDVESTLCQESLSNVERNWLRENRSDDAKYWHLLTDWKPNDLQYVGQ